MFTGSISFFLSFCLPLPGAPFYSQTLSQFNRCGHFFPVQLRCSTPVIPPGFSRSFSVPSLQIVKARCRQTAPISTCLEVSQIFWNYAWGRGHIVTCNCSAVAHMPDPVWDLFFSVYESSLCCNLMELWQHLNISPYQMNIRREHWFWMVPLEIQLFPSGPRPPSLTNGLSRLKPLQTLGRYQSSSRTSIQKNAFKSKRERKKKILHTCYV